MNGVIDLVDSDEDDYSSTDTSSPLTFHGRLSGGMSRSLVHSMRNTPVIRPAPVIPAEPTLARTGGRVVVDLISSDDEEPPEIISRIPAKPMAPHYVEESREKNSRSIIPTKPIVNQKDENPAKMKRQRIEINKNDYYAIKREKGSEPCGFGEANYLDEVVEVAGEGVEENERTLSSNDSNDNADNDDCDLEFLGGNTNFLSDMPHQREACSGFPFAQYDRSTNSKYCKQCFCYVCDINAKDCLEWPEHCNASYRIPAYKEEQRFRKIPALNLLSSADKARFFFDNKSLLSNEVRKFDISNWQLTFIPAVIRQLFKDLIAKSNEILNKSDILLPSDRENKRKLLQQATVWLLLVGNFYCTCVGTRNMDDLIESLLLRILFHSECEKTIVIHLKTNFQDEKRRKSCADLAKTTDILWDSGLINNLQSYNPETFNQNELLKLSDQMLIGIMKKIVRTSTLEKEGVLFRFLNILMDFNLTVFLKGIYLFLENSFDNVNERGNDSEDEKIELNKIKWKKEIFQVTQLIRSITSIQWLKDVKLPNLLISSTEELKSFKIVSILTSIIRKIPNIPSYEVQILLMKNLHLKKSSNRPYNQSLSNFTFLSNVIYIMKNQFGSNGIHPAEWVLNNFLKKWTPEEEYAVAISLSVRMNFVLPCCFENLHGVENSIFDIKNEENSHKNNKFNNMNNIKNEKGKKDILEEDIQDSTFDSPNRWSSSPKFSRGASTSSPVKIFRDSNSNKDNGMNDNIYSHRNIIKFNQNVLFDPCVMYGELYTVMDGPALLLLIVELKDICTYPSSSVVAVQFKPYVCGTYDEGKLEDQMEDHRSIFDINDNHIINNDYCDKNNNNNINDNNNNASHTNHLSSPARTSNTSNNFDDVSTYASSGTKLAKQISPNKCKNENENENESGKEQEKGMITRTSVSSNLSVEISEECFYHAFTISHLYLPAKMEQLDVSWEGQMNVPPHARGTYVLCLYFIFFAIFMKG